MWPTPGWMRGAATSSPPPSSASSRCAAAASSPLTPVSAPPPPARCGCASLPGARLCCTSLCLWNSSKAESGCFCPGQEELMELARMEGRDYALPRDHRIEDNVDLRWAEERGGREGGGGGVCGMPAHQAHRGGQASCSCARTCRPLRGFPHHAYCRGTLRPSFFEGGTLWRKRGTSQRTEPSSLCPLQRHLHGQH